MGSESINTTKRLALMSTVFGVTSCMLVTLPFIILQRFAHGPHRDWIVNSVMFLWFGSFICALWGSTLAFNAQKGNRLEGSDKKIRNIALIGSGLNFIGFALLLTLLIFALGPKVSVDSSSISSELPS